MTTETKLADLPANVGAAAQARRLYQHVCNGGAVTPQDICRIVATIEKLESALARQEAVAQDASSLVARLTNAAGLMLSEIDTCGHEVDPAYRLALYEAWEECKSFPATPPAAQAVDLSIFRDAVEYAYDYGSKRKRPERARLLGLIDQQAGKESSNG